MKRDLWMVLVCLMALLLAACTMNIPIEETTHPTVPVAADPAATQPVQTETVLTEQEAAIAQCRAVLEEVQSGTDYIITLTRWYEGIWDLTKQITYLRSGDDRAMVSRSSAEDQDGKYVNWADSYAEVYVDGTYYAGFSLEDAALQWEGPLEGNTLNFDPWLYTFDWDSEKIELEQIRKTEDGRCISFRVDGSYPNDRILSEYYTISFCFDDEGKFLRRELIAAGVEQELYYIDGELVPSGEPVKGGGNAARVDVVTLNSLDPDTCATEINALYQEALAYMDAEK